MSIRSGEFFAREGEEMGTLGFVVVGLFRLFRSDPGGGEHVFLFPHAGQFTGPLPNLSEDGPSDISAQALEDSRLLVAPYSEIVLQIKEHPAVQAFLLQSVDRAVRRGKEREVQLKGLDANSRWQTFCQEHPDLVDRVPRMHIASYLGITPQSLSRITRK